MANWYDGRQWLEYPPPPYYRRPPILVYPPKEKVCPT
jgi:hypothetical protein